MTDDEAARCYMAGWSDMRSLACDLLRELGRPDLADLLRDTDPPPSGDK
jgi:hypothetical protein